MLRMCKPIDGTGKEVILDSGFCVSKIITKKEDKVLYEVSLIKKRCCCLKEFTETLIDTRFQYKEVGDVNILEEITQ